MADITDHFTKASSTGRPQPTKLSSEKVVDAPTLNAEALIGWPTDTAVHFVLYNLNPNTGKKDGTTQSDWKGIVAGSTITNLELVAGSDDNYAIGTIVEAGPTAGWADDIVAGMLVGHSQDGSHKSGNTYAAPVFSGAVTGSYSLNGSNITANTTPIDAILSGSQLFEPFVESGMAWSATSGLAAGMTSGVAWVNGKRISVSSIASHTFTASKDTYVDIKDDGTPAYVEVANGATTGMTLTTNTGGSSALRVAKVVTNGSAVTGVTTATIDSIGNLVTNNTPRPYVIGYANINVSGAGGADTAGGSCTVISRGRPIVIDYQGSGTQNAGSNVNVVVSIYDNGGVIYSQTWTIGATNGTNNVGAKFTVFGVPAGTSKTYTVYGRTTTTGVMGTAGFLTVTT